MNEKRKTKDELIHELEKMHQQIRQLQALETKRKQTKETSPSDEEKYRILVDESPLGVSLIGRDGHYKYINPKFTEIFGYTLEDIPTGREWFQKAYPNKEYRNQVISKWRNDLKKSKRGEARPQTFTVRCKDGSGKVIHFRPVTMETGDQFVIYEDITERKKAEREVKRTVRKLRLVLGATVQAMVLTVEMRDAYTAGHQRRVTNLASAIAKEMHLSGDEVDGIRMAGSIHDIGKIGVPAEILNKPVRLAHMEFELIKTHPVIGYNILKEIQFPWPVAKIVLQHHERMDGSGYPHGLSGDAILIEARILGVADVVEALSSHRPFRPAHGLDRALEEISKNKGILYDADAVDSCGRLFRDKGFSFSEEE